MAKVIILAIAVLFSSVLASPNNVTRAPIFPSMRRTLDARSSSICINCDYLCNQSPKLNEATACQHLCAGDEDDRYDKSVCLGKKQRKLLALSLFREDAAYISTLDKHEIKNYLLVHMEPIIFADSKRRRSDPRFMNVRKCLDCEAVCDGVYGGWARPGDAEVCSTVCKGKEDDECKWMSQEQQDLYWSVYYGPKWKTAPPELEEIWHQFKVGKEDDRLKRSIEPPSANSTLDKVNSATKDILKSLADTESEDQASGLKKRYNPDINFNCFFMCHIETSVYNRQACRTVCKKKSEKQKCKTNLNNKQLHALVRAYYPGSGERIWNFCYEETKHDRTGCFRRRILKDFPDLAPRKHHPKCP
ncbi:uncharacterized protein N0V89_001100 [Didymosphaeria variabile]|uniref:Uncharacterized protein n=1 Tax=Didymosphaeria variabile TaxID=1932322 RepID=A0A9W8XXF0_9PLEO|nr:uncharacterized protein N0V89_001100 [Didymosphaeria variabile]KAJ4360535.1 hypothetical protein N0V89_001100 [Didymosphaeria variabile]